MCGDKSPGKKKKSRKRLCLRQSECVENSENRQVSTSPILEEAVHPNFCHNFNSQEACKGQHRER